MVDPWARSSWVCEYEHSYMLPCPVIPNPSHPIPHPPQQLTAGETEVNLHTNLLRRLRTTDAYFLLSRSLTGTEHPLGGDVLFLFVFVGGEADTEIHLSSSDSFPIWPISGHKRTRSPMKVAGTQNVRPHPCLPRGSSILS